jgi:CDP-glycerol glycerophosphotransferase
VPGRISVVVPIYNVELYLRECLESIAAQTERDLEVVMVDDGSPDGSAAIAEEFADADGRFRLVRQANAGLGGARNTGIRVATGELLFFVDSDDTLPPDSIERLRSALDETGSDFASGNVWRIRAGGLEPSQWLAPVFAETRLRTHVTKFRPLIADRVAWNKLWRRSFWDGHGFVFPKGLHEDIPVTLPAHFLARSVDVISEPIYFWRARVGPSNRSITQRRTDLSALVDRLAATTKVRDFLHGYDVPEALSWYDASIVADDLRPYLDALWRADDDYRQEFITRVNAVLDDADPHIYDVLPPEERRKWELVRARDIDGLVRLLRSQRRKGRGAAPRSVVPVTRAQRIARRVPRPLRRLVPTSVRRRISGSG